MLELTQQHRDALIGLCRKYDVRRLELFGSATGTSFNPQTSDLDFLVIFSRPSRMSAEDRFFGLLRDLEALFDRKIDLIDIRAARNPYFIAEALKHRTMLYAA